MWLDGGCEHTEGEICALCAFTQARVEQLEADLELEKGAHRYTIDMERLCGHVLAKLNHIVGVPEGSSLVEEIQKLVDSRAALAETRDALQQLVMAVERDDNPCDEGHSEHSDEMQKARKVLARVDSQGVDRKDSAA